MDLAQLAGGWKGTWRTWVQPDELYSEGPIEAGVELLYDGKLAIVRYSATLDGNVEGVAMIGRTQDGPVVSWTDTWHTSGLVMVSHGADDDGRFEVATTYRGEGEEWRWSSEYGLDGEGRFVVRHFNEGPEIPRYLGVEAIMDRTSA